MFYHSLVIISVSLLISGCTKPPNYPDEPQIEFDSWSSPVVIQEFDSLWVNLSFTDGDGDIGDIENTNEPYVFLTDTRDNDLNPPASTLPLVPQQGAGNGISGTISVRLQGVCCKILDTDPNNRRACEQTVGFIDRDTVVFEIYILDQAGNKSNVIQTDPLILLCQ